MKNWFYYSNFFIKPWCQYKLFFKSSSLIWAYSMYSLQIQIQVMKLPLREKCPNTEFFFWSVFSRIRTEYGDILRISPYSVRMRENTDQKKLRIWTDFTVPFKPISCHWFLSIRCFQGYRERPVARYGLIKLPSSFHFYNCSFTSFLTFSWIFCRFS